MNLLLVIFSLSIGLNLIVLISDIIPFLVPRIKKLWINKKEPIRIGSDFEKKIVNMGLEMAKSSKVTMPWKDNEGTIKWIQSLTHEKNSPEFRVYNYPRAFLFYGLSEYLINNREEKLLGELKQTFDKLMDNKGNIRFKLNRIDQVPFGLTSLNLYNYYKEDKYLVFSTSLYEKMIIANIEEKEEGIVCYRKDIDNQVNDIIGMTVPFLIRYYQQTLNPEALVTARNQMDYFIKYGIDKETGIPSHGVNRESKLKTGSINWGRGMGWYLLGLSMLNDITKGEYTGECMTILNSLEKATNPEGLWTQFPGCSKQFDASASILFMYGFSIINHSLYTKEVVLKKLSKYFSKKGLILLTSGDTYGLNEYSGTFGNSELSQGLLLLLIAKLK